MPNAMAIMRQTRALDTGSAAIFPYWPAVDTYRNRSISFNRCARQFDTYCFPLTPHGISLEIGTYHHAMIHGRAENRAAMIYFWMENDTGSDDWVLQMLAYFDDRVTYWDRFLSWAAPRDSQIHSNNASLHHTGEGCNEPRDGLFSSRGQISIFRISNYHDRTIWRKMSQYCVPKTMISRVMSSLSGISRLMSAREKRGPAAMMRSLSHKASPGLFTAYVIYHRWEHITRFSRRVYIYLDWPYGGVWVALYRAR